MMEATKDDDPMLSQEISKRLERAQRVVAASQSEWLAGCEAGEQRLSFEQRGALCET